MTAIVGILNTQGMALAADSAVTITSGTGVKKVYNKGTKIFALSKTYSVAVAIYNGSSFLGIPWDILLKMYRSQLTGELNTVQEYQSSFLDFLNQNLHRITPASKNNSFFNFASTVYNEVLRYINDDFRSSGMAGLIPAEQNSQGPNIIERAVQHYRDDLNGYSKNPNNAIITDSSFFADYHLQITEFVNAVTQNVQQTYPGITLTATSISSIQEALFLSTQLTAIFEGNSGLVFFGFGKDEFFPSSHLVIIGSLIGNTIRHDIAQPVIISPGTVESNIIPYAQSDVTLSVLTGIDPQYQREIDNSIRAAFEQAAKEVETRATDPIEGRAIAGAINNTSQPLIDKLYDYKQTVITQPLLNMLAFMGIEDMAELAESLVNVTSLKRKFTEGFESVGGPVDVVVVTKGDGVVWIKRKQYFTESLNKIL